MSKSENWNFQDWFTEEYKHEMVKTRQMEEKFNSKVTLSK